MPPPKDSLRPSTEETDIGRAQPTRPRAAILGAGVIGAGWAARFLLHGWDVSVFDPGPAARARVDTVVAQARSVYEALFDAELPVAGRLTFAARLPDAVAGADWVQESAPERLDVKLRLYSEAAAHLGEVALLASSTSGFRPSQLQAELRQGAPDARRAARQLIVCHPFNPVYLLPLAEISGDAETQGAAMSQAETVLTAIGMAPLTLRREIDAHIADRLLEAVWREALWLVRDGVATTAEVDQAIRMGFGLRWAQMGLFETYRIAGGEAGMAHFLAQFGPALKWPWSRLTDVPDLDDALVSQIAAQSDAQSGAWSISELETRRDANLVAMLRALRSAETDGVNGDPTGPGAWLAAHEERLRAGAVNAGVPAPLPA